MRFIPYPGEGGKATLITTGNVLEGPPLEALSSQETVEVVQPYFQNILKESKEKRQEEVWENTDENPLLAQLIQDPN